LPLSKESTEKIWKILDIIRIEDRNSKLTKNRSGIYKIRFYQKFFSLIPLASLYLRFEELQSNRNQFKLSTHLQQHFWYRIAVLMIAIVIYPVLPFFFKFDLLAHQLIFSPSEKEVFPMNDVNFTKSSYEHVHMFTFFLSKNFILC
jgi:hypothetical protein